MNRALNGFILRGKSGSGSLLRLPRQLQVLNLLSWSWLLTGSYRKSKKSEKAGNYRKFEVYFLLQTHNLKLQWTHHGFISEIVACFYFCVPGLIYGWKQTSSNTLVWWIRQPCFQLLQLVCYCPAEQCPQNLCYLWDWRSDKLFYRCWGSRGTDTRRCDPCFHGISLLWWNWSFEK